MMLQRKKLSLRLKAVRMKQQMLRENVMCAGKWYTKSLLIGTKGTFIQILMWHALRVGLKSLWPSWQSILKMCIILSRWEFSVTNVTKNSILQQFWGIRWQEFMAMFRIQRSVDSGLNHSPVGYKRTKNSFQFLVFIKERKISF